MTTDRYEFVGHRIAIRSNSISVLDHLRWVYGHFLLDSDDPTDGEVHTIEIADTIADDGHLRLESRFGCHDLLCRDLHGFDLERYPDAPVGDPLSVVQWLMLRDVGMLARDRVLVHSGAVARDGKAAIFPADSGFGKTTLSLRLALRGFGFLSDEVACLDPERGTVDPFPRRINLNASTLRRLQLPEVPDGQARRTDGDHPEWSLDVETIAPGSTAGQAKLRFVVLLRGFGTETVLEPIPKSAAAIEILKLSHAPMRDPTRALLRVAPVLRDTNCYTMIMGDLDEAADTVATLFED